MCGILTNFKINGALQKYQCDVICITNKVEYRGKKECHKYSTKEVIQGE